MLGVAYASLLGIALCYYSGPVNALDDFDLYKYGDTKVKIERTSFILKLVLYPTQNELDRAYIKVTGKEEDKAMEYGGIRAFTNMSAEDDVCTVHMIPPAIWDDRELLAIMGHEVLHCTLAEHQDADKEMAERKKAYEDREKRKKAAEVALEDSTLELTKQDKLDELENLRHECSTNITFDYIAGCKELSLIE